MKPSLELDLMRLIHGELPEERARELRQRLEQDPALAEAYRRLQASWEALSLPPAAPVPPGFAGRVMARARQKGAAAGLSLRGAPAWVRAAAAAALVAGAALGVGVGQRWPETGSGRAGIVEPSSDEGFGQDVSLAGSYWDTVEGLTP